MGVKALRRASTQAPDTRKRGRGDTGTGVRGHGIPLLHQRTTKLSAKCLVQMLHIIAEDGAFDTDEVRLAENDGMSCANLVDAVLRRERALFAALSLMAWEMCLSGGGRPAWGSVRGFHGSGA